MAQLNASPLGLTLDSMRDGGDMPGYGDGTNIPSRFNHPNNNTITFTPWATGDINDNGVAAKRSNIHGTNTTSSDRIYDSTLKNIIDVTQEIFVVDSKTDKNGSGNNGRYYPTKLKAWDFAYLKNTGVFPNNRLMIARRFGAPVGDDPLKIAQNPMSTMISWVPDGQDFLSFEVGEEWDNSEADFTAIFNDLGGDISKAVLGNLGNNLAAGSNAIPLPGFTEIFQRKVMAALGLATPESGDIIPSGTPNLIKEAKQRKTIGYGSAGSTLKAKVNIKMVCEWEQKFIAGIDPSIAWMDILNMVLRFSTSNSIFYLGETNKASEFKKFVEKLANSPNDALKQVIDAITQGMQGIIDDIKKALNGEEKEGDPKKEEDPTAGFMAAFNKVASTALSGLAKKYKVRLIGVTNALTGAHSTPWHITIGNPMRPIFCSGDMLVENVTITLGPELAFNDLPSTIKAEFTLTNARNLGAQEILGKFNVGYIRTVKFKPDLYESQTDADFIPPDNVGRSKSGTQSATSQGENAQSTNQNGTSNVDDDAPGTGVSGTGSSGESRVGNESDEVNPDANSSDPMKSDTPVPKSKYTYSVKESGPKKWVVATDSAGTTVYTGDSSITMNAQQLIQEAKIALNDN